MQAGYPKCQTVTGPLRVHDPRRYLWKLCWIKISKRLPVSEKWYYKRREMSLSHLLHDADGLGAVLRRRVEEDPVVERLEHRFHWLDAAHQTHQLCCNVANCAHYRCNPGRGARGAARTSALIGQSSAGGLHLLAHSWENKTKRGMKLNPWNHADRKLPPIRTHVSLNSCSSEWKPTLFTLLASVVIFIAASGSVYERSVIRYWFSPLSWRLNSW